MAEHKDYGLSGVHRTLQLGKQGPILVGNADTDTFTVTLQDGATLTNMSGANAVDAAHFITKGQLDVVYTEAVFKANVNYNDSSPILLGNISTGTKTIITTLTVGTAFDDANAVVTIGTSANANLLMSDNYCEIESTGVYQTVNVVEFSSNTSLNIYVTQAAASAGAGNVLVSVVDGPVVNGGTINYGAGGSSGISLSNLSVTSNSPSGNGSLSYNNSTGVFTFTPADASLSNYSNSSVVTLLSSFGSNTISTTGNVTAGYFVGNGSLLTGITAGTNYGDSNVVTLLSSFGSNAITTTGNVTAGNVTTAAGKHVYLGNASSLFRQLGSNSHISLNQNVTLTPDTTASPTSGVTIGGSGYILGPNNARNMTLNYNSSSGVVGFQSNIVLGTAGNASLNVPGVTSTGITAIVAGVTNTLLPNTIASFSANVNNYTQVTLQNKSTGADATADFIITADNGSDTVNYADLGIINSGYDNTTPTNSLGNIVFAGDTYLYAQGNSSNSGQSGGNIAIGATVSGKSVKIFAGGANSTAIVGTFSSTGLAVTGNVSATGITKTEQVHEVFTTKTSATGTVTHDCSTGQVFSHSSISANFTANFTNLNLDSGYATTVTLVLNQGATAYVANAVQIGGVSQTVSWQGSSSAPSGNASKKDVMSFSILNSSGTYTVLGQLTSFG